MSDYVPQPGILAHLPIVSTQLNSETTCPICNHELDDLWRKWRANPAERAVRLPCGHVFGATCIENWLVVHHTCPLCRRYVSINLATPSATISADGVAPVHKRPASYLEFLDRMHHWNDGEFLDYLRELADPLQPSQYVRIGNGAYERDEITRAVLTVRADSYLRGKFRQEDTLYASYSRRCLRYGIYTTSTGPVVYENLTRKLWDFTLARLLEALPGPDCPTAACHPAVGLALTQMLSCLRKLDQQRMWMSPADLDSRLRSELRKVPVLQRNASALDADEMHCGIDLEPYLSDLVEVTVQRFAADRPSVNNRLYCI